MEEEARRRGSEEARTFGNMSQPEWMNELSQVRTGQDRTKQDKARVFFFFMKEKHGEMATKRQKQLVVTKGKGQRAKGKL